jgi:CheY-like chemotaxis protein
MPKTLLLADDSVTIQKVVGITFANEDVELVTVDNGDDALVRARQIKPDLVLADIGMPGLDGYALCSAIRKDPNLAHTPVLLLTGTFGPTTKSARQVGATAHQQALRGQALVDRVRALSRERRTPTPRARLDATILTTPACSRRAGAPQAPRPRPDFLLRGAEAPTAPRAAKRERPELVRGPPG